MNVPRRERTGTSAASPAPVPLVIPADQDTIEAFTARLAELIASAKTRLYVDTSFLVWLTALGRPARAEFVEWVERAAPGRTHVPVWSAHEYLRHHVQDLHGTKLNELAKDLRRVADDAFGTLRPYLDSQIINDPRPPAVVLSSARASLIDIKRIADAAGRWRRHHYDACASEVIGFINRLGLKSPALLEWMNHIETLESARFEGRIPPGFQDRNKRSTGSTGSNRFGDLMFWKEILQHARDTRASGIVILSNDRKNDWNMGGEDQPELDVELRQVRRGLPPLPRPHPMLQFEARGAAGVSDLMLVDRAYLAIYLRRTGSPSGNFFSAAVEVTLPSPVEEDTAQRKEMLAAARPRRPTVRADTEAGRHRPQHLPTEDGPNVADTSLALKMALTSSGRAEDQTMRPVLDMMLAWESEGKSLSEFLTAGRLKSWETRGVVWFARVLGSRSIEQDSLATAYVTDILAVLDRLPPRTATALYLGLVAAAYLDGDEVRTVPLGPWLNQLFRLQSSPRAAIAIRAFRAYLKNRGNRPVYVLDPDMPTLPVMPLLETVRGDAPRLSGLQIADTGVIVEPQVEVERRLTARFPGRKTVSIGEVVGEACAMLGIPIDQVARNEALEREVSFGPTVGIASPADLHNGMEIEV